MRGRHFTQGELRESNLRSSSGVRRSVTPHVLSFPTFRRLLTFIRQIAGMPDYTAYVEHLRRNHPDRPVATERQFYDEFTRSRYEDGPTRCC